MLLTSAPPGAAGADPARLSARQVHILDLIAQGRDVEGIASELAYSVSTVKKELHHVLRHLGARNRTQAVAIAIRAQMV